MTPVDPVALAQEAREHAAAERWREAALIMRQALAMRPSHTFYARAQRTIDDIALHAGPASGSRGLPYSEARRRAC